MKKKLLIAAIVSIFTLSSVSVMAAESPTAEDYYKVTVGGETIDGSDSVTVKVPGGSIEASTGTVVPGDEITFTADPDDDSSFIEWVIDGDYTIVDGSLTDDSITIIPNGDISVDADFDTEDEDPGKQDPNQTSPETGAAAGALVFTLLASGGIAITSKKKLSK